VLLLADKTEKEEVESETMSESIKPLLLGKKELGREKIPIRLWPSYYDKTELGEEGKSYQDLYHLQPFRLGKGQPTFLLFTENPLQEGERKIYLKPINGECEEVFNSNRPDLTSIRKIANRIGLSEDDTEQNLGNIFNQIKARTFTPAKVLEKEDLKQATDINLDTWRGEIIEEYLYQGAKKDPDLVLVFKAYMLGGVYPRKNPNGIVVTQGGTGKTHFIRFFGEKVDKYTKKSGVGWAKDPSEIHKGFLHQKHHLVGIEQLLLQEEGAADYLFSYMSDGQVQVSGGSVRFPVKGEAPLVFTGNIIDEEKEAKALIEITRKLSKNPTIGRRLGLILFDPDMEQAKDQNKYNYDVWDKPGSPLYRMQQIWRSLVEEVREDIKGFYNREEIREWLNKKNDAYEEEGLEILEKKGHEIENGEFFKEFFKGQMRMRAAALNCAIVDFLPKFFSKEALEDKEVVKTIKERAEENYLPKFERINLDSLNRIIESETLEEGVKKRYFKSLPKYVQAICLAAIRYFKDKEAEREDKVLLKGLHSYYHGEIGSYSDFGRVKAKVKESTEEKYNPTLKRLGFSLEGEGPNWVVTLYSDLKEVTPLLDPLVSGESGESSEEDQKKVSHGSHETHGSQKGRDHSLADQMKEIYRFIQEKHPEKARLESVLESKLGVEEPKETIREMRRDGKIVEYKRNGVFHYKLGPSGKKTISSQGG